MSYQVTIEQFQGPLQLLLELIEKSELDISDVSLGKITESYLQHIESVEEIVPHELADFLLVAGRLLYLKSKLLLPEIVIEDEDDVDLAGQLKLYQRFAEVAQEMYDRLASNRVAYTGKRMHVEVASFLPPSEVTSWTLAESLRGLTERVKPYVDLPEQMMERTVSVEEKIEHLRHRIKAEAQLYFHDLAQRGSRSDVVASFLALLELLKQNVVDVSQSNHFSDISISRS